MLEKYRIDLWWDNEVDVWIATSNDIYGLVLEGDKLDELIKNVHYAASDLLELNHGIFEPVKLDFYAHREEMLAV
ncbi:MAG: DUF1902 domain-containing protein [Defluviitaleaceae bacterium]|nr:DUF1902 domain-containing protein [Defluviitaleaceae bacterium]MCL2273944.1 DUF1902 domain-containing protein [Defluviitaleaceae bacterium]